MKFFKKLFTGVVAMTLASSFFLPAAGIAQVRGLPDFTELVEQSAPR
jgi:hypothetical protein